MPFLMNIHVICLDTQIITIQFIFLFKLTKGNFKIEVLHLDMLTITMFTLENDNDPKP